MTVISKPDLLRKAAGGCSTACQGGDGEGSVQVRMDAPRKTGTAKVFAVYGRALPTGQNFNHQCH
jgi:hypothetical protein